MCAYPQLFLAQASRRGAKRSRRTWTRTRSAMGKNRNRRNKVVSDFHCSQIASGPARRVVPLVEPVSRDTYLENTMIEPFSPEVFIKPDAEFVMLHSGERPSIVKLLEDGCSLTTRHRWAENPSTATPMESKWARSRYAECGFWFDCRFYDEVVQDGATIVMVDLSHCAVTWSSKFNCFYGHAHSVGCGPGGKRREIVLFAMDDVYWGAAVKVLYYLIMHARVSVA